jgi:hypothetical protein
MHIAYIALTVIVALLVVFSGVAKVRRDPKVVKVVHETVGVPMKYFLLLALCEFAGGLGLVMGIWWPVLGIAAGIGLVVYFVGAAVGHLRADDAKGMGASVFMLALCGGALALRFLTT